MGPLLEPPNSNLNLPLLTLWTSASMYESGDSGMPLMRTPIDTLWDPTKILEYLPKKTKIQILIENPNPTFTSEMQTKGISNWPWPNDYNEIINQRYKIWMPQGRIPDKFTVLEEPKEEQTSPFLISIQ